MEWEESTHILMARVCKNDDGKRCKSRNWTSPLKDTHSSTIGKSISLDEMCHDENHKVGN